MITADVELGQVPPFHAALYSMGFDFTYEVQSQPVVSEVEVDASGRPLPFSAAIERLQFWTRYTYQEPQ